MKLITISIAAYNVEKYLKRTLNSLIHKELLDKIEVLIIDDGSKDGTSIIAKEYEAKYPETFKYVAKENGGHGSTINKGIELATGKYFRVLDGDDYINTDDFVKFISFLENTQEDMVITNYLWVDDEGNSKNHNHREFLKLEDRATYKFNKNYDTSLFGLSTISIRTELLKKSDIKIREKCFYVDVEFVIWCIYLSKGFAFCNYAVYMYRCLGTTDNSINKANMLKNVRMQEAVVADLLSFYNQKIQKQNFDDGKEKIILQRIEQSIAATVRTYLFMNSKVERRKCITNFDSLVKAESITIFNDLNNKLFMRVVRMCDYKLISLISVCYELYAGLKK